MRAIFLLSIVFICIRLNAQDTIPGTKVSDTATFYLIKLIDNTSLTGKIIERNSKEIVFLDITIGKVNIPIGKIQKINSLSGSQYCLVTTTDGKQFSGLIIRQNENEIIIKTESLGEIAILNSKIREIKLASKEQFVQGKYYFPNPHPTRYFFGPSAIPLEKSEGYYQNAYLLSNCVQIGVSDNFSLGGGTVIPFLFYITPKIGYKVGKGVYLGGGILAATSISSEFSVGLAVAYGSLTFGNKENNFTINGGWGFIKQEIYYAQTNNSDYKWTAAERPMFSLSGALRIAPKVALISENWIFAVKEYDYNSLTNAYKNKYQSVLSFGFRLMGEKNSFDIAVAIPSIEGETIGLPYLDYVFKF